MSKRDNGKAASPYSLEAYSDHLPAQLRPGLVLLFSYYSKWIVEDMIEKLAKIQAEVKYTQIIKIQSNIKEV